MKQVRINFKELKVEVGVDQFELQDWRKAMGNALHRAAERKQNPESGRKIYYSEGPIDILEEDFKTMLVLLGTALKRFLVDAVAKAGEESETKNKEE